MRFRRILGEREEDARRPERVHRGRRLPREEQPAALGGEAELGRRRLGQLSRDRPIEEDHGDLVLRQAEGVGLESPGPDAIVREAGEESLRRAAVKKEPPKSRRFCRGHGGIIPEGRRRSR